MTLSKLAIAGAALALLAAVPAGAQDPCPATQPETITATGKQIRVCFPEPTDSFEVEVAGASVSFHGPFGAGPHSDAFTIETGCAEQPIRVRGSNAAGPGTWGSIATATFPLCKAPIATDPLP